MIKTVKLQNTLNRTFNGVKPNGTINVEENQVAGYLANGFVTMRDLVDQEKELTKAEKKALKAKQDAEAKEKADADAQAQKQAELDAEHAEKNAGSENAEGEDGEATAEDATKAEDGSDAQALNAELAQTPAPKNNKKK